MLKKIIEKLLFKKTDHSDVTIPEVQPLISYDIDAKTLLERLKKNENTTINFNRFLKTIDLMNYELKILEEHAKKTILV